MRKKEIYSVLEHIDSTWDQLTFNSNDIFNQHIDTKLSVTTTKDSILYYSSLENKESIIQSIRESYPKLDIDFDKRLLPITSISSKIAPSGLIYLPNDYIIPGGMFNEMYGWDSFFIIVGLLESDAIDLALGMANNLLYMVEHFGKILNANRTYYLNRSQPPLLANVISVVYKKIMDKDWLANALPLVEKYYEYWQTEPQLIPDLKLSRYAPDLHHEPLVEVPDSYYDEVKAYFRDNTVFAFDVSRFYDRKTHRLKPEFYSADAAMRESGFDVTNKFGPFSADILQYAPIGLNSLLFKECALMSELYHDIEDLDKSNYWAEQAREKRGLIRHYLYSPALNQFFDLNFETMRIRPYTYATTFYPLWAGLASPQEGQSIVKLLSILESQGGVLCSTFFTGMQWDAPFGWAPHQYMIVQGLLQYGYKADALRIAKKFLSMVVSDFSHTQCLFEKYDVLECNSEVNNKILYGYKENVRGFGWTNAVVVSFYKLILEEDPHFFSDH